MRSYIEIPTLTEDNGILFHNQFNDTVESLIPNPYNSCHAADLLELPNGDILCAWFAGSAEGRADISIVLSRLNKDESSWQMPIKVSDDPERSEQNPSLFLVPAKEGEPAEIWCMYTAQVSQEARPNTPGLQSTAEIRRKVSRDNGYTWGPTEVMFPREGSFCRQKIQVLSSGRWIFGNWICFPDNTHYGSDITVMQISDDQGKTWREVEVPNSRGRVHANIVELEPGRLIALFRSRSADNIYIAHSNDNGDTWTEPVRTELPNNNSSISAIKLQSGAIAIVYNPYRENDDPDITCWPKLRCPIEVAISDDGGETWPIRRLLDPCEGFTGRDNMLKNRRYEYPVMMQSADGKIHIAFSWGTRTCIKYYEIDEDWIRGAKFDTYVKNSKTPVPVK